MKHALTVLATCLILVGCTSNNASSTAANATQSSPSPAPVEARDAVAQAPLSPASTTTQQDGLSFLKPGMAYSTARQQLLSHGWQPLRDEQCMTNVVGANFKDACQSASDICHVCDEMQELSAYSSDAHALSQFKDSEGRVLRLTSLGEVLAWNAPETNSDLQVLAWEIEAAGTAR